MDELIEGYRRFRTEQWPTQRARYEALSLRGQKPHTLVVACSDSRVDPATVFSAGPGELFVVRNVAGLVPPYAPDSAYHGTSAALEFGVRVLGVRRIVVLGHAQCGGVQAMVEGVPEAARDFVAPWVEMARSALDAVPPDGDRLEAAEAAVVRLSLDNLRSFPWIEAARAAGDLELAGFRFGIRTGLLWRLEGTRFVPIA